MNENPAGKTIRKFWEQQAELDRLLEGRVVSASSPKGGNKPLSVQQRRHISNGLKNSWAARKAGAGDMQAVQ